MSEVRAKKALGQHFLVDLNIARKICDSLGGGTSEKPCPVLEVGCGMGVLTRFLLKRTDVVTYGAEIDSESVAYLHAHYPEFTPRLMEGDFLKMDLRTLFPEGLRVIGNFPYNISSQIFFKVLENRDLIPECVGMINYKSVNQHSTMNTKKIPFSPPDVGAAEAQEVTQTLLSGWITTGPRTKEFEREIAAYCHTEKAVCLNSATACMEMILRVLGVGPGDEVITSAYTYTATASVTCHVGAKVVLVDTAPGSFEMDYDKLADAITEKTKVVIPVDLAGIVCDYDRIFAAVESRKQLFRPTNELQKAFGRVIVLADAAHAFGAKRAGRVCGEIADFTSFSFHAVKNLTTAEGGALTWRNIPGIDNEWLYKQFQLLSLHGQSKDALAKTQLGAWEYDIVSPAYKCNMTDIMAGIGLVQLKRYPELLKRRREIIERYDKALRRLNVQVLDHYGSAHASSGHLYLVRLLGKDVAERNDFITRMAERGIACNVHYKPLPMMTAYKALGFDIEDYPNAYDMYRNEVTLPLHTRLTDEDIDYVLTNFTEILSK